MRAAPCVLTRGRGRVPGRFRGNGGSGLSDIPVVIVNLDDGQIGQSMVDTFQSADLADLVEPTLGPDPEAARRLIDEDEAAAAIIIPAGFTRSIILQQSDYTATGSAPEAVQIEVYANPQRPTSAGVIKAIVDEFLSRVEEGRLGGEVSILQMLASGRMTAQQAEAAGTAMGQRLQGQPASDALAIQINSSTQGGEAVPFDALAYIAPGMALMFLMYTVSYGGRSILAERSQGTLPRLLVSPTSSAQIWVARSSVSS
jgi:ABC-2 type transport system permease protein